jgi:hypothetical protein
MSVTITIENNHKYIDANHPELITVEVFDKDIDPDQFEFKVYPFELNLANGNFACVWQALGLYSDDCYCGSMSANLLISYLNKLNVRSIKREDSQDHNVYTQGIDLERASRYYWSIMSIAQEAKKRDSLIVWG